MPHGVPEVIDGIVLHILYVSHPAPQACVEVQRVLEDMVAYSEAKDGAKLTGGNVFKELRNAANRLERLFEAVCMAKSFIRWATKKPAQPPCGC